MPLSSKHQTLPGGTIALLTAIRFAGIQIFYHPAYSPTTLLSLRWQQCLLLLFGVGCISGYIINKY